MWRCSMLSIKSNRRFVFLATGFFAAVALLITPLVAQDQSGNSGTAASPSSQPSGDKPSEPRQPGYGDEILNNPNRHVNSETTVAPGTIVTESTEDPSVEPRREPSAEEILRELSRRGDAPRPVILPVTPGQQ